MSEQLYDSEPNGVTWAENLDRIGDAMEEIRDLLRDHLPERMAEAWTPESMVDDYTERPWSDDVRAADVVNDQDAEIARLREEVERLTWEWATCKESLGVSMRVKGELKARAEDAEKTIARLNEREKIIDRACRESDEKHAAEVERLTRERASLLGEYTNFGASIAEALGMDIETGENVLTSVVRETAYNVSVLTTRAEQAERKWDEARQLAQRKWEQDRLWLWKTADAATRAEQAESRERKLREALERFGDHLPGCAHWHDHIYPLPECSCGFHAALAAPPEEVRL